MKHIISLLFLLLFFNCKKEEKTSQNTNSNQKQFITIVFNRPQIVDTIWYNRTSYTVIEDPIYYRIEGSFINKKISVDKNKTDTIRISTNNSIYLSHSYGLNYSNTYLIKAGDFLEFKYKNNVPYLKNKNNNINYNSQTAFNLKNPIEHDEMIFFEKYKRLKNKDEIKKDSLELAIRDKKQMKFLDSIRYINQISENDYNLYLLPIINKHKLNNKNSKDLLKDEYNLSIPSNSSLVKKSFEKINKPNLLKTSNGRIIDYLTLFDKALNEKGITQKNKIFLMFTYLDYIAQSYSKEQFMKRFDVFTKANNKAEIIDYFKIKYPKLFNDETVGKSNIRLVDVKNNQITLEQLIKKSLGSVIYIDFWASWCTPCRVLLPKSHELKSKFDDKGVVFVYISIDDNAEKWKSASSKENLIKNNYLAKDYPYAPFYKEIVLNTIPRYMIFDKKGNLVNSNAPSPESREIIKELNKYLID
jgi:thiol-disulfide isomerase/thioredoxin